LRRGRVLGRGAGIDDAVPGAASRRADALGRADAVGRLDPAEERAAHGPPLQRVRRIARTGEADQRAATRGALLDQHGDTWRRAGPAARLDEATAWGRAAGALRARGRAQARAPVRGSSVKAFFLALALLHPPAPSLHGLHVTNGSSPFQGDRRLLTTVSPN